MKMYTIPVRIGAKALVLASSYKDAAALLKVSAYDLKHRGEEVEYTGKAFGVELKQDKVYYVYDGGLHETLGERSTDLDLGS